MPEAPEVEAIAQSLRPLVNSKTIRDFRTIHPIGIHPQSTSLMKSSVEGNEVQEVTRHGKYLILQLTRGCLVFHFKFDGQLIWFDHGKAPKPAIHIDALFEFPHGSLAFVDPRHLGRVHWHSSPESVPGLCRLGVDVFSRNFTPTVLAETLHASNRPLKEILLDQTRVAGIGNIYSNEALWHARLNPRRAGNRVAPAESLRLHKAIVSTVRRALECCCNPAPDFRDPNWWFQGLDHILRAYGREGLPCKRCGARVKRIQQGGRSSFFCPRCQR